MAKYTINAVDSESPSKWMDLCTSVRPIAQDDGRCVYEAETADAAALEAALEADDDVRRYEDITPEAG